MRKVILPGRFKVSHLVKQREVKELHLKSKSRLAKDPNFTGEQITDANGIACH